MKFKKTLWIALLAFSASAQATVYNYDFTGINAVILDNNANGYQNSPSVFAEWPRL